MRCLGDVLADAPEDRFFGERAHYGHMGPEVGFQMLGAAPLANAPELVPTSKREQAGIVVGHHADLAAPALEVDLCFLRPCQLCWVQHGLCEAVQLTGEPIGENELCSPRFPRKGAQHGRGNVLEVPQALVEGWVEKSRLDFIGVRRDRLVDEYFHEKLPDAWQERGPPLRSSPVPSWRNSSWQRRRGPGSAPAGRGCPR